MDYVYKGDRETADMFLELSRYGQARCEYYALLQKTQKYNPGNTQLIDYCERKIEECRKHEESRSE